MVLVLGGQSCYWVENCQGRLIQKLAGRVCDRLRELGADVTDADKTCVMMAGLFHDAGQNVNMDSFTAKVFYFKI